MKTLQKVYDEISKKREDCLVQLNLVDPASNAAMKARAAYIAYSEAMKIIEAAVDE